VISVLLRKKNFFLINFKSHLSIGVPMLLIAWSITEVIRYSFYALNLINAVPYLLIWMRYIFFLIIRLKLKFFKLMVEYRRFGARGLGDENF
jgi:hypothetical protein